MTIEEFLARCKGVVAAGDRSWKTICPCHADKNPSLSVSEGIEGRILLRCHAGCESGDVVQEMGLQWSDLMPPRIERRIAATYDYHDAEGRLAYQVVRYDPKGFAQRRPNPEEGGEMIWNMKGTTRVLYHLPQIRAALAAGKPVYIVEGEKDADALISLGFCATTNVGGAGKWRREYATELKSAQAIIIPDGDGPGRTHAQQIIKSLDGIAAEIRVLKLPSARAGQAVKDIFDWLSAGGTAEELVALVAAIPPHVANGEDIYYNRSRRLYVVRNKRGIWSDLSEGQLRQNLIAAGYTNEHEKGQNSEMVAEILRIRDEADADYVGPLAGWDAGLFEDKNRRIVVTEPPTKISLMAGEWSVLRALLDGMLGRQAIYLHGWLQYALRCLHSGVRYPAQAMIFAGPAESGKSLVQQLITELLGGRSAKPYRYMTRGTEFNGDLFGAEHLVIEDEAAATDHRARRAFGAEIKQITADQQQRCHAKYQEAITLSPFWRLSISLNQEEENMQILPPLDESLVGKLILLSVAKKPMPMPSESPEEKSAFWKTLVAELPAYAYWLKNEFRLPQRARSSRYGVAHYQDSALAETLHELSEEAQLLDLIDRKIFGEQLSGRVSWDGSASELRRELLSGPSDRDAEKVLKWMLGTGFYLARLAKRYPQRVQFRRSGKKRKWIIYGPIAEEENAEDELTEEDLL